MSVAFSCLIIKQIKSHDVYDTSMTPRLLLFILCLCNDKIERIYKRAFKLNKCGIDLSKDKINYSKKLNRMTNISIIK